MATWFSRVLKGSALTLQEYDDSLSNINTELEAATAKTTLHDWYHFHGCAANQIAGDAKFFDTAAGNHGVFGANLSNPWATSGYVSTVDPTGGAPDSVIRIPAVNFDYNGGQKLIVAWWGKITPEGSNTPFIGDGYSTTAGQRGWQALAKSDGKMQLILYGAASGFSATTASVAFDGTLHGIAFAFDGSTKKYGFWVDETLDAFIPSGYASFNAGASHDTLTTNTVNVGAASASPGGSVGIATQTRGLVILRGSSVATMPTTGTVTSLLQALRTDMTKRIAAAAF